MYLGIDIGTSSVKAVIVDDKDTVVEQASAPLNVSRPHAGWSEQNPADWWSATNAAVKALPADDAARLSAPWASRVRCMARRCSTPATSHCVRPFSGTTAAASSNAPTLEKTEPRSRDITGNIAMPGFTAPKLVWVRENEPAVFKDTRCVLLPKDYVRLLMTGEKASDCSDAAGTLWVDVAKRQWSPEMLAATGLNESHMPRLVEGSDVTGNLRQEVAADWGMDSVPVAGGGGDNAAGAAGIGVITPGDAFLSLGTSGVLPRAGEDDLELVAAEARDGGRVGRARHEVVRPHRRRERPRHLLEHLVAGVVAVAVVDLLEVVDVDHEHAAGPVVAAEPSTSLSSRFSKWRVVAEVGEAVVDRLDVEPRVVDRDRRVVGQDLARSRSRGCRTRTTWEGSSR